MVSEAAVATRTGRKRGNNEGSIRQRPDGTWEARLSLPDGKRKSFYGQTRADVAKRLTEARRALDQGLPVSTDRQTVGQYMTAWLRDVAAPRVRASTLDRYTLDVARITRGLGTRRLSELAPQHVQAFINEMSAAGLAPATVRHTRAVLRSALEQAELWGLIARNPAARRRVTVPRGERPGVEALAPETARAIVAAFRGDVLEAVVYLALATGARQGELLGLRWDALDLDGGTLTIRTQLQRIGRRFVLTEPKSKQSRRVVALPPGAVDLLRARRIQQLEQRLAAGDTWAEPIPGLVFTRTDGGPLYGSWVTNHFQRRLRAAGLPRMPFHHLRHGAASLLIAQGADLRRVMEQLGHSQISMTANTYAHISAAVPRDNANLLHAALSGAS
jgi:integrase